MRGAVNDSPVAPSSVRRVLATRHRSWAKALAAALGRSGVRPNTVSVASIAFAFVAGAAFALSPHMSGVSRAAWLLVAGACIQLRLLCNMLDGMLAVEEGLKSKTGDIYNEFPDRLADVLIIVGAGYGTREVSFGPTLGWLTAILAVLTAYVRLLSGSLGLPQHFLGPMAKQHRMFTLTLAAVAAAVEAWLGLQLRALWVGLLVVAAGTVVTVWRRVARLMREAEAR
jgi:phosphatidylglycerophosphate synthase